MPNIPTFTSEKAIEGIRTNDLGAEAWQQEGRRVGIAFHQLGEDAEKTIGQLQEHDDLQTSIQMTDSANKLDASLAQEYATRRADPNFDMNDWISHVSEAYSGIANTEEQGPLGSILGQSDKVRAHAAAIRSAGVNYWTKQAIGDQMQLNADRAVNTGNEIEQNSTKTLMADPSQLGALLELDGTKLGALYSSAKVPAEKMAAEGLRLKNAYGDAAIEGWLIKAESLDATPQTIAAAKAAITNQDGLIFKSASPNKYGEAVQRLNRATASQDSINDALFKENFNSALDHVSLYGDPQGKVAAQIDTYQSREPRQTPIERAEMHDRLDEALAVFGQQGAALSVPTTGEASYLGKLQDDYQTETDPAKQASKSAALTAASKVLQQRDAALQRDPAGWVLQNDRTTANLYGSYLAAQTPQDKAAAFDRYAIAASAIQARVAPDQPQSVLTDDVRNQAAQAVRDSTSTQGAGRTTQALAGMASTYGRWWPGMAAQLTNEKVLTPELGVAASLYADPRTQALAETTGSAALTPKADRIALHGITDEKAQTQAGAALQPLAATYANVPMAAAGPLSNYRQALAANIQYTGASDGNALASRMLLDKFDIRGTIRVPAGQGLDADRIQDGANAIKSDIGNHELVVPPSYTGLHGADLKANYARQIETTGRWYTNENGTGLLLYDEDMHNVQEIRDGKKVDVEVNWTDLGKAGDQTMLRAPFSALWKATH